ncbi:phosphopantetheine adenylyltransferase [Bisgaardia hudsonensis]|uniref:Phosphopantetheine adenylyltransferase n=1 Tax=Bisgaardia hudsonensis TaxID=109472 RepID=A0A4R2MTW5_9PAST|nr:pantetheine-phosphate adenylyltransferase [Bisgaardia hudsonensis]QLB13661.1 pantetheine-phosphate adenylyltransferase [Bisgaardia hudsonensis]TCP11994.1 phosphopantetheine adenylyltransferase [Bisgaardia hudsonensis]
MIKAIYPGTFDPVTNGHLDIIQRSANLFEEIIIAVANNPSKNALFSLQERVDLMKRSVKHLPNVKVVGFSHLLADMVKENDIKVIIRGVRTTADFEYELQLAYLNRLLTKGVESLFLPPSEKWAYVSSTIVRDIYLHKGDISQLVPETVLQALSQRK